jgi:radical SAM superfamily enzyme YgiQ (UPF0313 family)
MPDIVLATLNAKYIHTAFGLRYLLANLGPLRSRATIVEFDINQRSSDIVELLLAREPKIIGFGIYIWNVAVTTEVVATLKRLRPELTLILGGPEVSYECEEQAVVRLADYVITGEADLKFAELCGQLLAGDRQATKILTAGLPDLNELELPYHLYSDEDVTQRIVYVEASRGCPFTCEFCLSSLEIPVRQVPLPALLDQLQNLLQRGVKQFKFVDRTFNLNLRTGRTILEFFLDRYQPGYFFHFEMVPDRLPEGLREVIAKFPAGTLQFEVGIQTFNEKVSQLIQRRQNYLRLEENLCFLRQRTGVHIHADLIAGLPGETLGSFAAGFDRLVSLGPQEIQVGILKRLRGTPIVRHDAEWRMVYNPNPPYEILENRLIEFDTMQKLRRFARYWDLVANSGNFLETVPLIWRGAASARTPTSDTNGSPAGSPFAGFMRWSEWLHARVGRTDSIALMRLMELLLEFLTKEAAWGPEMVAQTLWRDYQRGGRRDKPSFLKQYLTTARPLICHDRPAFPKRQARHLA